MPSINEILAGIDDRRRVTGRTLRDAVQNPGAFLDQIVGGARELSPEDLQAAAMRAGSMFGSAGPSWRPIGQGWQGPMPQRPAQTWAGYPTREAYEARLMEERAHSDRIAKAWQEILSGTYQRGYRP